MPETGADGVVIAQGGAYGGWSVYAHDGQARVTPTTCSASRSTSSTSDSAVPAGDHELRAHFAYDGGGVGKGGTVTLFADDDQIGEGRVERTIPFQFSFDETVDVGLRPRVAGVHATTARPATSSPGTLHWVRIDLGDDDHSHLIDPEHRLQVAMMKQ